jgi:hypothetical protein
MYYHLFHSIFAVSEWCNRNAVGLLLGFLAGLVACRPLVRRVFRPLTMLCRILFTEDWVDKVDEVETTPDETTERSAANAIIYDQDAFARAKIRLRKAYAGKNGDGDLEIIAMIGGDDDFEARPGYRLMLDAVFRAGDGSPRYSFPLGRLELEENPYMVLHEYIVDPDRFFREGSEIMLLPRWESMN